MPRGKYVNHKGRSRNFTDRDELEREEKLAKLKKKRAENADGDEENDSDDDQQSSGNESGGGSGSDDSDSDDDNPNRKSKGVSGLIKITNPNHVYKKATEKVTKLDIGGGGGNSNSGEAAGGSSSTKPELSRREREEIEKQRAEANYQKLHAEGKTDQARADLARLAIIKQQRADAAAKREAEKKVKEVKAKKPPTK